MSLDAEQLSQSTGARAIGIEQTELEDGFLLDADSELRPWLSIVMPTLNEEAGIAECIHRAKQAIETLEVPAEIIVSDSSTDRTPAIARELGAIVVNPEEDGYGAAYRYAFARARGNYVIMGDADCTYDFAVIPDLLEPVVAGEADIVLGSRLNGNIEPGAMPLLHQYIGNPLLTRFLNAFYNAGVSDAHSGFRVFRREVLEELDLRSNGMEFASEMVMDAASKGLVIEEVPITYHQREGEATLSSFHDGWRHVKFMLVNAPGYLFSGPGFLLGLVGVLVMGFSAAGVSVSGLTFGMHTMVAGSLLTVTGYQVASLGIFATVAGNPIRKPADPVTDTILRQVNLERGASLGIVIFTVGAGYGAYLIAKWIESGYVQRPPIQADILAFTAMILGIQLVFGSFFFSAVAEGHD